MHGVSTLLTHCSCPAALHQTPAAGATKPAAVSDSDPSPPVKVPGPGATVPAGTGWQSTAGCWSGGAATSKATETPWVVSALPARVSAAVILPAEFDSNLPSLVLRTQDGTPRDGSTMDQRRARGAAD